MANTSHPGKQWSRLSWLATATEGSKPPPAPPSKASEGSPADEPKKSPYLSQQSSQVRGEGTNTNAQPQLLRWECGHRAACCWRRSCWKPPASRNRPPAARAGPGPPAWIHPHSPAMSAASPRLGTSCHPASTRHPAPGTPASSTAPQGSTPQGNAAAIPRPFASQHAKAAPRPPTRSLQDPPLEHSEPQGRGGPAGTSPSSSLRSTCAAAKPRLPAVLLLLRPLEPSPPGKRPGYKAPLGSRCLGSTRIPQGARQPQSVPLACEPSWGTASPMPGLRSRAMETRSGSQTPESGRPASPRAAGPSPAPSSVRAGVQCLKKPVDAALASQPLPGGRAHPHARLCRAGPGTLHSRGTGWGAAAQAARPPQSPHAPSPSTREQPTAARPNTSQLGT